jgi:hypothetical protein
MISPMAALLIASIIYLYRDLSKLNPLWSFVFMFSTFFFAVGVIHFEQSGWLKDDE